MKVIRTDDKGQTLLFPIIGFGAKKPSEPKPPPAHHGVDTSQAAAAAVARKVPSRKELARRLIEAAGERGLTNYELAAATGWMLQSTTPITNALASERTIYDSGRRRPSPVSGTPCKVWVINKRLAA
jgi:hypothetical protein